MQICVQQDISQVDEIIERLLHVRDGRSVHLDSIRVARYFNLFTTHTGLGSKFS